MPHCAHRRPNCHAPDIVTVEEAQALFATTRTLSYRVCYFTLYRLGERRTRPWPGLRCCNRPVHPTDAAGRLWLGRTWSLKNQPREKNQVFVNLENDSLTMPALQ